MPSNIPRPKRRSPTKVDFDPGDEVVHQKASRGKKVTQQHKTVDARTSTSDGIVSARGVKWRNASKDAGDLVQVRTSASENQVSVRGGMHQRSRKHRNRKANEEENRDKSKLRDQSIRTSVTTVNGGDGQSKNASTHRGDGEMVSNTTISIIGKSQMKDAGGAKELVRIQEGGTLPVRKPQTEQGKETLATKTDKLISLAKNIWTFLTPQPPKRKIRPPRPRYKPKSQPWHTARIFELKMREKAVDSPKKYGEAAVGKRKIVKKEYIEMDQYVSKKGVKKDKVVEVIHARVTRKTSKGVIQGETVDQEMIVEKVAARKRSPIKKYMKSGDAELEVEKRHHRPIEERASRSKIGAHYDRGDTEANHDVEKSRSPKQVAGGKRSQRKKRGVLEEKVDNTKVRRTTSNFSNESDKYGQCKNVDCAVRFRQVKQSPTQENLCGKIKRVLSKSRQDADSKTRSIICPKECPGVTRALRADELSRSKARGSSRHSVKSNPSPENGIKETDTRDGNKRHKSKTRGDAEQGIKSNTSLATETKEKELKVRKKRQKSPGRDTSEQVESKRKKTKQRDSSKPNVKSTPPPDDDVSELEEAAEGTRSKSKPRHASKPKAKPASSSVKEIREPKDAGEYKRKKSKPRDALKSNLETTPSVDEDNIRDSVKCAGGTCRKSKTRDASKPKVKSTSSSVVADKGESKENHKGAHRKSKKRTSSTPPADGTEKSDKFIEVKCKKLKSPDSSKSKIKSTLRVDEKESKHNKSKKLHESTSPPVEKIKVKCVEGTCKKSKSRDSSRSQFKSNLRSVDEMKEISTDEEVDMPSVRPRRRQKHKGEVEKTCSKSCCNMLTSNDKTGRKNGSSLLAPNDRKSPNKLAKETRSKSKKRSASSLPPAEDVKESAKYVESQKKKSKSRDSFKPKPKSRSPSVEEVRESTKCDEDKCRKSKSRDDFSKQMLKSSRSPTKGVTRIKESKSKTRDTSEHSVKSTPSPLKGTKHKDKTVVEKDSKSSNRKKPSKPAENTISVEVITTFSKRGINEVYKTRSKSSDNQLGRQADEKPSKESTRRLKREQSKNEMLGLSTEEETELSSERPRKPPRVQGKERKGEVDKTVSKNSTSVLPPNDKTGRKSSSNGLAPTDKKSPHKLAEVTELFTIKSKGSVKKIKSENIKTVQTCGQVNDSEKDNFASENAPRSSDEMAECGCQESKLSEQILRDIREEAKRLGVMTSSAYKFLSNLNEKISVLKENVKRSKSVHGDGKRISPKSSVTKKRSKSADVTTSKHDNAETCPKFEERTSFRNLEVNDIECGCEDEKELITENEKSPSGKPQLNKVNKSSDSMKSAMAKERVERKKSPIKGSSSNKASVRKLTDQNNAFASLGEELLTTLRNDPRLLQNLDALVEAIRSGTPYKGIPSNKVKTPKASPRSKAVPKSKSSQKHNLKAEMKSNLEKLEEEPDETSEANKETKLKPKEQLGVSRERAGASPEDNRPSGENFQNQVECDIFSMELSSFQKKFGRYLDDSCLERWKERKKKAAEGPRPVTKTKSEREGSPPSSRNRNPRLAKNTAPVASHKISSRKNLAIPITHDFFKQHGHNNKLNATETHGDACEQTGDWVIKLSQPVTFNEIKKGPITISEDKPKENVNPVRGLRNYETDVRSCFRTSRRESNSFREPGMEQSEGEEISNRRRSSSQVKVKDVVENKRNCSSGIALTRVENADIHMKAVDICKRIMKDKPLKGMAFDKLYENIVSKLLGADDLAIPQEQGIETETFNYASPRSTSQDQSCGGKSIRRYRLYHHKRYCKAMPKVRRQPESKNKNKSKGKFRPKNHQLSQDEVSSLFSSELNNTKTSAHRIASNRQIQNEDGLLSQGIKVEAQRLDRNCQQANIDNDTNFSTFNRNEKGKCLLKVSERKYQVIRGRMDSSLDKTKYKSMIQNDDDAKSKDISFYANGTPTYSEFSGNPLEEDRDEDLDRLVSASELRKRETPSYNALEVKVEPSRNLNLPKKDVPLSTKIHTPRDVEEETTLKDSKNSLQRFTKIKDVLKKIPSKEMRATQGKTCDTECQTNAKKLNSSQWQRRKSTSKEMSNLSENFKRRVPAQELMMCMRTKMPSISKPFQENSNVKNQKTSCIPILPLAKFKGGIRFVQNNNNEEIITDETKGPDVWPNNIHKKNNTRNKTKCTPKAKKTPFDCNDDIKNNKFVSNLKSVNPRKIAQYLTLDRKLQQEKKETSTRPTTACTSKTNESKSKGQSKAPVIGRPVNKGVPQNKFSLLKNETINREDDSTPTDAPTSKNDKKSSKFPNKMITRNKTVGTDTQKQPPGLLRSKTFTCDEITDRESSRGGVNKQQASPKAGTQNRYAPSTGNRAKSAGLHAFRASVKVSPETKPAPSPYMSQQNNLRDKIRAKSYQYPSKLSREVIAPAVSKPTQVKNPNGKFELGKTPLTNKGQVYKSPWGHSLRKHSKTNVNRTEAEKTPQTQTPNNKQNNKLQIEALPSSTPRSIITPKLVPLHDNSKKATMGEDVYKSKLALKPTKVATDPMLVIPSKVKHIYTVKLNGNPSPTDCGLENGTSSTSTNQEKKTQRPTFVKKFTKYRINRTGAEKTPQRGKLQNEQCRSKKLALNGDLTSRKKTKQLVQQDSLANANDNNQVFQKKNIERSKSTITNNSQDQPDKGACANNHEYLRSSSHSGRKINRRESSTFRKDTTTHASSREIQHDTSLLGAKDDCLDNASGQNLRSLELSRTRKLVPNQQSLESGTPRATRARPSKPNPATRRLPRVPSNIIRSHSFLEFPRSVSRTLLCAGSKNFSKINANLEPVDLKVFASPVKIVPSHTHKVVDARELTSKIRSLVHVEPEASRKSKNITEQNSNNQNLDDKMACSAKIEHEIEIDNCSKVNQKKQSNSSLESRTEWMKTAEEKKLWWEKHVNGFEDTVLKAPDELTDSISSINRTPPNFVKRNIITSSHGIPIAERNRELARKSGQRRYNRTTTQNPNGKPSRVKQVDEENVSSEINVTIAKREGMENGQEMIDVDLDVGNNRRILSTNGTRNEISRESSKLYSSTSSGSNIKEDDRLETRDNKRMTIIDRDDQTRHEIPWGIYEQKNYAGTNDKEIGLKSTGAIPKYRGNGDKSHSNFTRHVDTESESAVCTDMINNPSNLQYEALQEREETMNVTMVMTPRVYHGYQSNSNHTGLKDSRSNYMFSNSDENISNSESCEEMVKQCEQQISCGDNNFNYGNSEGTLKHGEQQMSRQDNKANYENREEIVQRHEQLPSSRDKKSNYKTSEEMVKHLEQTGRRDKKSNYETSEKMVKRPEQQKGDRDNKNNYETCEEMVEHHVQMPGHRDNKTNYETREEIVQRHEQLPGRQDKKSNYKTSEEMIKQREWQMGDRDNKNNYETCQEMVKHHVQMPGHRDNKAYYETREEIVQRHDQLPGSRDKKCYYETCEEMVKRRERQMGDRDNKANYETGKEMLKHHERQTDRRDHKSNYETSEEMVKCQERRTSHRNNKPNYETREDTAKFREQQTGLRDKSYTCIGKEESDSSIVDSGPLVKKFSGNRKMIQKEYSSEDESEGSGSSSSGTAENIDSGILGTSQRNSPLKESSSATVDTSNTSRETAYAAVVCRTDTSASTTGSGCSSVSTEENSSATQDDSDSVSKSSGSLEQCSYSLHKMREDEPPKPKERQTDKESNFPWTDFHRDYVEIPVLNDLQTPKGKQNKNGSVNLITPSSENLLAQAVGSRKFSREQETMKPFYKTVQIPHGPRPSPLNVEDLDQYQDPKSDKGSRVVMGNSQSKVTHNKEAVVRMPTIFSENNSRAMKRDVDGRAVHRPTTPRGLKASKTELPNEPSSRQISPARPPPSPSPPPRNSFSPAPDKQHGSQDNRSSSMRAESLGRNTGRVSSRTRQCDFESVTRKSNHYERDSVAVKSNINDNGGFSERTDIMSTTHKGPKMLQVTNCVMEKNNTRNMIQITNDREGSADKFRLSEDEAYLSCFYDESMFMKTSAKKQEEYYQGLETGGSKYHSGYLKKTSNAKNKAEKGEHLDKGSSRPRADNVDAGCLLEKSKYALEKIDYELDRKNAVEKRFDSFVPPTPEKSTSNREGKQPYHEKRNARGANVCLHEMAPPEGTSQRTDRSSMGTSAKNYIEIIKAPHGISDSECSYCTSCTSLVCNSDKHTRITSKLAQTKLTTQYGHIETVHHVKCPQTPKREDVRLIEHKDCERLKVFGKTDKRTLETVSKKSEAHNQITNSPDNDKQFNVGYKKEIHVEKHPLGTMTSSNLKVLDTVYKNNSCQTGAPSEEALGVSCDKNSKLFQILTRTVDGNGEVKNYLIVDNCMKELVIVDNKIKSDTVPSAEVEMGSMSALKTLDGPPTQESDLAKRTEVALDTQKSALNFVPVNENIKDNKRKGTETSRNSFNKVQQSNITEPLLGDAEEQVKKGKTRIVANVTIEKRNVGPFEAELQRESNDIEEEQRVDGSDEETSEDDESSSSSGDSDSIQQRTESRSSDDSEQLLGTRRKSDLDVPWSLATNVKSPVRIRTVNVISNPDKTREWDSNASTSRTSLESTSVSSPSNDDTSSETRMKSLPTISLTTSKDEQHSHSSSTMSEETSDLHIKTDQSRHAKARKNSKVDQSNSSEEKMTPAMKESISSKERMPVESSSGEDLVQLTLSTIELIDSATAFQPTPRSTPENISAVEIQRKTSASRGTMTEESSKSNTRKDSDDIRKHSINTLSHSDDDRKYSLDTRKDSDSVRIKADDAWKKGDDARKQSEHNRISSHDARKHSDEVRINADDSWKKGDDARKQSEHKRISSLDARKHSDDVRIKADDSWKKGDDARKQSEHDRISSHDVRKHSDDVRIKADDSRGKKDNARKQSDVAQTISTDETITPRTMSLPVSREILRSVVSLQTDRSEPRENVPANNRTETQIIKKQYTVPNEKIPISKKNEKKFAEHVDDHKDKVPTSKTEKTSEKKRKKSKDDKSTTKTRSSERSSFGRETEHQTSKESSILQLIYERDKQKFDDVKSYTESFFSNDADKCIETDSQEYDIQINKKYVTDSSELSRKTKRVSRDRIEEEDLKRGHFKGQPKKQDNVNVKNHHSKKGDSGKHKIFTQVGRWIGKKIDKI